MKIVVTDGYELNPGDLEWANIDTLGEIEYYDHTPKENIEERCTDAQIIITNKTRIDSSLIEASKQLKLITVTATGYNNIDLATAKRANVAVCNVPEYGTFSVAQHAFALILELVNHVGLHAEGVKRGDWTNTGRWSYSLKPLMELKDKTLGIIGFGRIGQQVAKIAKALGMQVIYTNRSNKSSDLGKQVSMEQLFSTSDIISLHCPLTNENAAIVNLQHLSMMKPTALLINTSRGQLINEPDLAQALKDNLLSAAALDVLSVEPPPPYHPLIRLPNCIITPHNAWSSFEARSRIMEVTYQNIRKFLDGNPPKFSTYIVVVPFVSSLVFFVNLPN